MSSYGHELPWQIITFGIQFNKGTNFEWMADEALYYKIIFRQVLQGVREKVEQHIWNY